MAMSYEGIVSRKDTDRGVTLKAKVVTPNKLKAGVKEYPVTIKGMPLSAYDKAMEDARTAKNTAINELGGEVGIKNVAQSLRDVIIPAGPNGSTITFSIENNPSYSPLVGDDNAVFNNAGIYMKRPGIGKKDAVGEVKITATNEGKAVTLSIPIIVKAAEIEEFLTEYITFDNIWDNVIRGENNKNGAERGYITITKDLDLGTNGIKILNASTMEKTFRETYFPGFTEGSYIKITTTITDNAVAGIKTLYKEGEPVVQVARIGTDGHLAPAPEYDDIFNYINNNPGAYGNIVPVAVTNANGTDGRYFKINGIGISCSVQFCDAEGNADTEVQAEPWVVEPKSQYTSSIGTKSQYFENQSAITRAFGDAASNFKIGVYKDATRTDGKAKGFKKTSDVVGNIVTLNTIASEAQLVDFDSDSQAFPSGADTPVIILPKASTTEEAFATMGPPADINIQFTTAITAVWVWDDMEDATDVADAVKYSGSSGVDNTTTFAAIFGTGDFAQAFKQGTGTASNTWIANINKEAVQGKALMFEVSASANAYSISGADPASASGQTTDTAFAAFKFAAAAETEPGE